MAVTARDRVIDAATALLQRAPLSELTVAAIARAAGVSRQTIYTHFNDADDIAASVFIAYAEQHLLPKRARARTLEGLFWADVDAAREFFATDLHLIAGYMLGSQRMRVFQHAYWIPALERLNIGGDLEATADWLIYQQTWLVAHPGALTNERAHIRRHIIEPLQP